ncbi:DUF4097 family beta strand repeat-containing protein [Paenibacillus sp. YPG26]|uniref:DUF4097 family beta strand repeat-containing protein n=1 Tax=Paenibacillus sp. YPG26 TaxID=2878915 RepID=UPI00203B0EF8|nr:DUF4097 family beta strand repeat-containing protein [Paenibacillus sp. YPG26]USB32596.1 DUF4097 family beta strand repeat-containing protein [Paenibacillus sp. YPG26]
MSLNLPGASEGEVTGQSAKSRPGFKPRRRKRKFIAGLLAALFPGLGHLYLRMFRTGIRLIYLVVIDVSAILYFSSVRFGVNVPLLILLALLIPVVYFYSVYSVLQNTDALNSRYVREDTAEPKKIMSHLGFGLLLIAGGLLVFAFHLKPVWLNGFFQYNAGYCIAAVFIISGVWMIVRELQRRLIRTGRFTASLMVIALGILIILDQWLMQDYLLSLLKWWPLMLILIGIEYIALILWKRLKRPNQNRKLRFDLGGLLLSLILGVSVFAITQQDHYLHLWNRVSLDLTAAGSEFSDEKGYKEVRDPIFIPVDIITSEVRIDGINGRIAIERAPVDDIIVRPVIWIDRAQDEDAETIAKDTIIQTSEGAKVGIAVQDRTYGASGSRHPRVNLTVVIPESRKFDFNISTTNGGISMVNIEAVSDISLQTGRGNLYLNKVTGDVTGKTLGGRVELHNVTGKVDFETLGGRMIGMDIYGPLKFNTMIGDISIVHAGDDISANTRNGNISVDGVYYKLQAESLNGQIRIRSPIIGGDWTIYSAVGEIDLRIPAHGNYSLTGSSGYGEIKTNLPFDIDNMTIKGGAAEGKYKIDVEGNSDLNVRKYTN